MDIPGGRLGAGAGAARCTEMPGGSRGGLPAIVATSHNGGYLNGEGFEITISTIMGMLWALESSARVDITM